MKKLILMALLAGMIPCFANAQTDEGEYSYRQGDYKWLQFNLYSVLNQPNPFGDESVDFEYFELEGGGRSGILALYYFFDVNNVGGWGDNGENPGDFFAKIMPKFSIDGMLKQDLAMGPIKEFYIATMWKGWNGGEVYDIGLGVDLAIPGIDAFSCELMSVGNREGRSLYYSGMAVTWNWYTKLFDITESSYLTYQGWGEFDFANDRVEGDGRTETQLQWHNAIFYNFGGHYALSAAVKFYKNFLHFDTNKSDETAFFFGAHYKF